VLAFVVAVRRAPEGSQLQRAVDDLGLLLAAATAAVACGWRARRSSRRVARPWWLLAAATGSWALGEAAWSYYELLADRETPFPSAADAGFLGFSGLAAVAVLLWPSEALRGAARWRALLDGVLVAGALFIITWVSALGSVVEAGGDNPLSYAVSLAYPIMDLVLLTLTLIVAVHGRREASGTGLGLLAAGLAALCVADSGFAYLTAAGTYVSGSPVDAGWFGGFLMIAAAAWLSPSAVAAESAPGDVEATARMLLPYLPAAVGLLVVLTGHLRGSRDPLVLVVAGLVTAILFVRQLLTLLDNRLLVRQLLTAQAELRHQAFHDPLTGLANRALFTDRLRHGLALHRRDMRPLSLLYCDLDGFKTVNDTLGHDAGDEVLKAVAERLLAITRAGDTVARLGGDEFVVLIEDGGDAGEAAARIAAALAQPAAVGRHRVELAASIGIAELTPQAPTVDATTLLQRADAAMYHAKRGGTGRKVARDGTAAGAPATA
jgi:diguanylate cyclase (GGDEF)-like protein